MAHVLAPLIAARWSKRWKESLVAMVALESICAELMTLPFVLHTFGQMSFIGLVANVLVCAGAAGYAADTGRRIAACCSLPWLAGSPGLPAFCSRTCWILLICSAEFPMYSYRIWHYRG